MDNTFQFEILNELIKQSEIGNNIVISPLSIYKILSLCANGADKKTLKEMVKSLCNKSLDEINDINRELNSTIDNFKTVTIANSIFTFLSKTQLEKKFLIKAGQYNANVEKIESCDQINKWCSNATNGKITEIIDSIDKETTMILINAIYFKGEWEKKFDKSKTEKKFFFNYKKEKKLIDFMFRKDKYYCYENEDTKILSLNYQKDNIKALIIMPSEENDINEYAKNFTIYNYKNILNNLTEDTVSLYFPKFEINYKSELNSIFQSLGMKKAFIDEADFSLISNDEDMKIDKIIHKAYIKVDEEGTEASAATAVKSGRKVKMKTPDMIVDHPFLFIIRNENLPVGHDILFICVIEDFKDIKSQKNIKDTDTDTGINNPQTQQINNQINNNINLLEFDYVDKPNKNNNNNNNNIDLLGDIFQSSSSYNVMNNNFNINII